MIPNQDTYHPGDIAQLLVVAPFAKASGLLSIVGQRHHPDPALRARARLGRRQGSDRRHRHARGHRAGRPRRAGPEAARRRDEGSRRFLPVRRSRPRRSPLQVQPANETLTVTAVARDRVTEPGAHDTVDVSVKAPDGSPVANADVAVVVVDEAVLVVDRLQARRSDRRDVRGADRRAPGRLSPQQPGAGEPQRVRRARDHAHDHGGRGARARAIRARGPQGLQGDEGIQGGVGPVGPQGPAARRVRPGDGARR